MSTQNIIIVTVNYKTPQLTCEAVDSVAKERQSLPFVSMIIVDNCSEDDSFECIQKHVKNKSYDWVNVIQAETNAGYAAGNNIALREIEENNLPCEYLWFLNPDTKLRPDAGVNLVGFLESKEAYVAGSRLEDEDGTPQVSNFNFPSPFSELCGGLKVGFVDRWLKSKLVVRPVSNVVEACDWLAGASIMMKYSVIQNIGLMDEEYFLYFEEVDYCLQAQRKGFCCWYVPESRVFHAVGAATGISNHRKQSPRRPKYWFDSRRRFYLKNYGVMALILADCAFISAYTTWVVRSFIFNPGRLKAEPPKLLREHIKNSFVFRGIRL